MLRKQLEHLMEAQNKTYTCSFDRRPDVAELTAQIRALISGGFNGTQIQQKTGITRGQLLGVLKREGWSIPRNAGRSKAHGNVKTVKETLLACPACGKINSWKPWQTKHKENKFCNGKCAGNER